MTELEAKIFKEYGEENCRKQPDGTYACIYRFITTTGICYGLDEDGMAGRYCFKQWETARQSWDLQPTIDALHPPVDLDFIKHKGRVEFMPKDIIKVYNGVRLQGDNRRVVEFQCKLIIDHASPELVQNLENILITEL